MNAFIILDNGSGEIDREPVAETPRGEVVEMRKAVERLVARTAIFYVGDIIKVIER